MAELIKNQVVKPKILENKPKINNFINRSRSMVTKLGSKMAETHHKYSNYTNGKHSQANKVNLDTTILKAGERMKDYTKPEMRMAKKGMKAATKAVTASEALVYKREALRNASKVAIINSVGGWVNGLASNFSTNGTSSIMNSDDKKKKPDTPVNPTPSGGGTGGNPNA